MANYAYIQIRSVVPQDSTDWKDKKGLIQAFSPILTTVVAEVLGEPWRIQLAPFEDGGPTWLVFLPNTAMSGREAGKRLLAPGQNVGFPVALQTRQIAFRHGLNLFERWAQGRVEEQLSDFYKRRIYYDASESYQKLGVREYRSGKTFADYLARNFEKPLSEEDKAYVESYKRLVPDGYW